MVICGAAANAAVLSQRPQPCPKLGRVRIRDAIHGRNYV